MLRGQGWRRARRGGALAAGNPAEGGGGPAGEGRARCRGGLRSGNGVSQSRGETGAARGARGRARTRLARSRRGSAGGRGERTRLAHAAQKHLGRERAGLARTHARARGGERRGRRAEARAGGARLGSGGGWDLSTTARVRAARRLLGDPRRDVVVHDGNRDARPAPRSARRRSGLCRGDARERASRRFQTRHHDANPQRRASRRRSRKIVGALRANSPIDRDAPRPLASAHSAPAASLGPARIHHGFERRWR